MERLFFTAIGFLFFVGIIWFIFTANKRINNALKLASEALGFTSVLSKNIFRKKKILGELDGYNCEVEVYTRSYEIGRASCRERV